MNRKDEPTLFGMEEFKKESDFAKDNKDLVSSLQKWGFSENFGHYMVSAMGGRLGFSESLEAYYKHIKDKYKIYVEKKGWSERDFITVVWNIALAEERYPSRNTTYEIYYEKLQNLEITPLEKEDLDRMKREGVADVWELT